MYPVIKVLVSGAVNFFPNCTQFAKSLHLTSVAQRFLFVELAGSIKLAVANTTMPGLLKLCFDAQ